MMSRQCCFGCREAASSCRGVVAVATEEWKRKYNIGARTMEHTLRDHRSVGTHVAAHQPTNMVKMTPTCMRLL
jgi:hypothetical protein